MQKVLINKMEQVDDSLRVTLELITMLNDEFLSASNESIWNESLMRVFAERHRSVYDLLRRYSYITSVLRAVENRMAEDIETLGIIIHHSNA